MIVMVASPSMRAQLPLFFTLTMPSAMARPTATLSKETKVTSGESTGTSYAIIGTPAAFPCAMAGTIALESCARMIAASQFEASRLSTSVICFCGSPWAAHVSIARRPQHRLDPRLVDPPPFFLKVAPADANSLGVCRVGWRAGLQSEAKSEQNRASEHRAAQDSGGLYHIVPPFLMALTANSGEDCHIVTGEGRVWVLARNAPLVELAGMHPVRASRARIRVA